MESIKHAHRAPTSMHTGGRHKPHKRHPIACTGTLNLPVYNKQKGNLSELINLKPLDKLDLQHRRTVEKLIVAENRNKK